MKQKITPFKTRWKYALLALMAFLLLGAGKAKAQNQLPVGQGFNSYTYNSGRFYFTPSSDGILTMETNGSPISTLYDPLIYKYDGQGLTMESYEGSMGSTWTGETFPIITSASWKLSKEVEYYFDPKNMENQSISFTFFSDEEEPGPKWQEVEMNKEYTNTPFYLKYNPPTDGTLYITQDYILNQLYTDELCEVNVETGSFNIDTPAHFEYSLTRGKTYYYKSNYATSVIFSWETSSTGGEDTETIIKLNTQYQCLYEKPLVGTFTPDNSGTLKLTYTDIQGQPLVRPMWNSILFLDDSHEEPLNCTGIDGGISEYEVIAGQKYYVYLDYSVNYMESNVVFSMGEEEEEPEVKVWKDMPFNELWDSNLNFKYTAEDGVYGILVKQKGTDAIYVYTDESCTTPANATEHNFEDPYYEYTISVETGKTYYYSAGDAVTSVLFQKVTEPTEPDTPQDWTELEFKTYNNPPYMLHYKPTTNGILTVEQSGTTDPALFTSIDHIEGQYPSNDGYTSSENGYIFKFSLEADKDYYYYSEEVTSATFSWEEQSTDIQVVQLNTPYSVNLSTPVMVYMPDKDCTLIARRHNLYFPLLNDFLFTDYACSDENLMELMMTNIIENGGDEDGRYYYFNVTANTPYYFHYSGYDNQTFTFSISDEVITPELASVYPEAGSGFDPDAYETTFNVSFIPANIKYDYVTVKYTDPENKAQSATVTNVSFSGDELHIGLPQYVFMDEENNTSGISILANSDVSYTIHNVTYNGEPVTRVKSGINGYNFISADGNGNFTIKFSAGTAPAMTSQRWPSLFLGLWEPGDPDAVVTIEFDQPLKDSPLPDVTVIEGAQTSGSIPADGTQSWVIPSNKITVSGNTLTIDLSGNVIRSNNGTVTVQISGLWGKNGILATYNGEMPYMYQLPFQATESTNIYVNVGDIKPMAWTASPILFNYVYYNEDEEIPFNITVTPDFETKTAPSKFSEDCGMTNWEWAQMVSIQSTGTVKDVDAYYVEPVVSDEEYLEVNSSKEFDFKVKFGCSGRYKISITSNNSFVKVVNGEQTIEVYPSITNTYTYTHTDVKGNQTFYTNDCMTINGYGMRDGNMDYSGQEDPGKLSRAVVLIPGLYLFDNIYYSIDAHKAVNNARAITETPAGYQAASDGRYLDLSDLDGDSDTHQLSLIVSKNGASTPIEENNQSSSTFNFTVRDIPTGVEEITIGNNEGTVEYYDLNGVKVNPENLVKGIYIKVENGKASKIAI